jgi:hypothetical protein
MALGGEKAMNGPNFATAKRVFHLSLLAFVCLTLARSVAFGQSSNVWIEGFEAPDVSDHWTIESGVWQFGTPTGGPGSAYAGTNVAGTVLSGAGYPETGSSRLISPSFVVPAAGNNPRLRFWHWFSFGGGDGGTVQLRIGTNAWQNLTAQYTGSTDGRWSQAWIDLTAYAGQTVQIGFLWQATDCCGGYDGGPGWYIDEVRVETGTWPLPMNNPEGFEGGWGGWVAEYKGGLATDYAVWEFGAPTGGPGSAYAGTKVAAAALAGNYPEVGSSRLVSPPFTVPCFSSFPRLKFNHWYSFGGGDSGVVQLREGTNQWVTISTTSYTGSSAGWGPGLIDLSGYADRTVQIGFLWQATDCCGGYDGGPGWYIDEVSLVNDTLASVANIVTNENISLSFANSIISTCSNLTYCLSGNVPSGASIDPGTGVFTWNISECQGPGVYSNIIICVQQAGNNLIPFDYSQFTITVNEINNCPPVLAAIGNKTIDEFYCLAFRATATDCDCPTNLTFSLDAGAPTGAVINPVTGWFNWTPTAAQGPGSYPITVRVTDGGPGPLSDTKSFTATVNNVGPDNDNDGLPDSWETLYGLSTNSAAGNNGANGDPDGDGMTNVQEFGAGTDPTNRASVFRITRIDRETNGVRVAWTTVGSKRYQVQSTLAGAQKYVDDFWPLSPVIMMPPSGESTTNYLDVGGISNGPVRIYRVRVLPPPPAP